MNFKTGSFLKSRTVKKQCGFLCAFDFLTTGENADGNDQKEAVGASSGRL